MKKFDLKLLWLLVSYSYSLTIEPVRFYQTDLANQMKQVFLGCVWEQDMLPCENSRSGDGSGSSKHFIYTEDMNPFGCNNGQQGIDYAIGMISKQRRR